MCDGTIQLWNFSRLLHLFWRFIKGNMPMKAFRATIILQVLRNEACPAIVAFDRAIRFRIHCSPPHEAIGWFGIEPNPDTCQGLEEHQSFHRVHRKHSEQSIAERSIPSSGKNVSTSRGAISPQRSQMNSSAHSAQSTFSPWYFAHSEHTS